MIKISGDKVLYIDVDQTLIDWYPEPHRMHETISIINKETVCQVLPNLRLIEKIRHSKARGHRLVVWSAGGVDFAERVVIQLGLENIIDLVISKPSWVADDLPASEFIPEINRIYIKP